MSLEIAVRALRDDELKALYVELIGTSDKRLSEIEAQFKIRLIDKQSIITDAKNENPHNL